MNITPSFAFDLLFSQCQALKIHLNIRRIPLADKTQRGEIQLRKSINDLIQTFDEYASLLAQDLLMNQKHIEDYNWIKVNLNGIHPELIDKIENIKRLTFLLNLAAKPLELKNWLSNELGVNDVNTSNEGILAAFDAIEKKNKPKLTTILSEMIVIALKIQRPETIVSKFNNRTDQLKVLAHLVNAEKKALKDLKLTLEELNIMAPHLRFVNCYDVDFKNEDEIQTFLNNCKIAETIWVNSDKLKRLDQLPKTLQILTCLESENLTQVNGSECQMLRQVTLRNCIRLNNVNIAGCRALRSLDCEGSTQLEKINAYLCDKIEVFTCIGCTNLKVVHLSCDIFQILEATVIPCYSDLIRNSGLPKNPSHLILFTHLNELFLSNCNDLEKLKLEKWPNLNKIALSNCEKLAQIVLIGNPNLKELHLSNCPGVKKFESDSCLNLEIFS